MATVANLFSQASETYHLFSGGSSSSLQDGAPLLRMGTRPSLEDLEIDKVSNVGKQRSKNRSSSWCYFLHAFLIALHLALLVISVSNHPERRITVDFASEASITGLSGGLQAFYTLYTALLVFLTQRLALSAVFSTSKRKLTQIHDICGAWAGFGSALSALWSQTKVASSVSSIILVTTYFACVTVLHVVSSTIMQLQPFNDTVTTTVLAVTPWPDKSVNLSSLDWTAVTPLVPFLHSLYGDTTNGLTKNTLYGVPTQSFAEAKVVATTLNAHCGLLTNLSIGVVDGGTWNISVPMTNVDHLNVIVSYPPLPNEIWLSPSIMCRNSGMQICRDFILYLVSTVIESDDSVNGISHAYLNGTYGPDSLNISTPISLVACTLDSTTRIADLDSSANQLGLGDQQTDIPWTTFIPGGDTSLTRGISYAIQAANSLPLSPYCQPIMATDVWNRITAFNAYTSTAMGMNPSFCNLTSSPPQYSNGTSLVQYTSTSSLLTRSQVENATSRIATEFIWLAGELGNAGGGFDRQMEESRITEYVLRWRLNINPLPVVVSLCGSVVLCVVVVCMLWDHDTRSARVSGAGVLDIMWLGSRSQALRDRLMDIKNPSVDGLRAFSMFESNFWTRSAHVAPEDAFRSSELHQYKPFHTPDATSGRRWCYMLHIVLVALHILLLVLLVRHPEHSVIIPFENDVVTAGLGALLEAIYTAYSALLVTITQRLAIFRIVSERRRLTTVHDVSGAWTGVGAAIYILWQQRQVSSSIWEVGTVATYLTSMLVLHIGSSSIMQWQASNLTIVDALPSDLALPSSMVDIGGLGWSEIFFIVQSIGQDTGVSTYGLSNRTLYDVPRGVVDVALSQASVSATTIDVQCGLVPNLTVGTFEKDYRISFDLSDGTNNDSFLELPLWKDVVYPITPKLNKQCAACPQTLFYMITTGVDVDASVRDSVTVKLNWTYTPPGAGPQLSETLTYVGACSVSSHTVSATLDLRGGRLSSTMDQSVSLPSSTSWSVWSPGNATNLSVGMATAFMNIDVGNKASAMFKQQNTSVFFKETDMYLMNMLGLDLVSANASSAYQSSANPFVTLSPAQLENAIALTAARFLWLANSERAGAVFNALGARVRLLGMYCIGGFISTQYLYVTPVFTASCAILSDDNQILFASIASFTALILVPFIIGKRPSKYRPSLISGTSVLESLWLEAQSETLHLHLSAVREPCSDRLRAVGMFDIFLGDVGQSSWLPRARVQED